VTPHRVGQTHASNPPNPPAGPSQTYSRLDSLQWAASRHRPRPLPPSGDSLQRDGPGRPWAGKPQAGRYLGATPLRPTARPDRSRGLGPLASPSRWCPRGCPLAVDTRANLAVWQKDPIRAAAGGKTFSLRCCAVGSVPASSPPRRRMQWACLGGSGRSWGRTDC
jgi:hypothetical protein